MGEHPPLRLTALSSPGTGHGGPAGPLHRWLGAAETSFWLGSVHVQMSLLTGHPQWGRLTETGPAPWPTQCTPLGRDDPCERATPGGGSCHNPRLPCSPYSGVLVYKVGESDLPETWPQSMAESEHVTSGPSENQPHMVLQPCTSPPTGSTHLCIRAMARPRDGSTLIQVPRPKGQEREAGQLGAPFPTDMSP